VKNIKKMQSDAKCQKSPEGNGGNGIFWNGWLNQQPFLRLLAVTSGATDDDVALQGARTELDGVGVTEVWVAKLHKLRKSEEIVKLITL